MSNNTSLHNKQLLSCPKLASSDLQKAIYEYLYEMYPTPVTPEEILKHCGNENTEKKDIWFELDKGPLRKVIHYKGKVKYLLNKRLYKTSL